MWKTINDNKNNKTNMNEIFLEQANDINNDDLNDKDLQLALKLSLQETKSSSIEEEDNEWEIIQEFDCKEEAYCDDVAIAKLLQQQENDQYVQDRERLIQQENIINSGLKIKIQSHDNVFNRTSAKIYNKSNNIQSSNRDAAEILSSQLLYATGGAVNLEKEDSLMFKGGTVVLNDGTYITKHDPLLKSLTNSVTLSELPGVGDLHGLVINNEVGNSLRNSIKNIEKDHKDMNHKKYNKKH